MGVIAYNGKIYGNPKQIASGVGFDSSNTNICTADNVQDAIEQLDVAVSIIEELQNEVNNMQKIYYGYELPDSSFGKEGDVFMLILEDATTTSEEVSTINEDESTEAGE